MKNEYQKSGLEAGLGADGKIASNYDLIVEPNFNSDGYIVTVTLALFEDRSVGIYGGALGEFTKNGFIAYKEMDEWKKEIDRNENETELTFEEDMILFRDIIAMEQIAINLIKNREGYK